MVRLVLPYKLMRQKQIFVAYTKKKKNEREMRINSSSCNKDRKRSQADHLDFCEMIGNLHNDGMDHK